MNEMIDLKELFYGLQQQMSSRFDTNRKFIPHAPKKGESFENLWIEWLKTYLPNRYDVDSAFIIDSEGTLSHQMDLVIYDQQYTPFIFNQDEIKYIPAESVYAVFDVKPELSKETIEYTGKKIKSVRDLKRTSAKIYHAGGFYPPKPLTKIIGGILAIKSSWKPALGKSLENHLNSLPEAEKINIGCAVDDGSFVVEISDNNDVELKKSSDDEALIFFFLKLYVELQRLATVSAIDVSSYAKVLNSKF